MEEGSRDVQSEASAQGRQYGSLTLKGLKGLQRIAGLVSREMEKISKSKKFIKLKLQCCDYNKTKH